MNAEVETLEPPPDVTETRVCPNCERELPLTREYFYRRGPGGRFQAWCRECQCRRDRDAAHRATDPTAEPERKRCTRCLESKPLSEFARKITGKYQSWCRECSSHPYATHVIGKPPEPERAPPAAATVCGSLVITPEHAAILTASGWAAVERMKARAAR